MPISRRSSASPMEALTHEHYRVLIDVKNKTAWILTALVDVTRHHGKVEGVDQNSSLVDLYSKKKERKAAQIAIAQLVPPRNQPWRRTNPPRTPP